MKSTAKAMTPGIDEEQQEDPASRATTCLPVDRTGRLAAAAPETGSCRSRTQGPPGRARADGGAVSDVTRFEASLPTPFDRDRPIDRGEILAPPSGPQEDRADGWAGRVQRLQSVWLERFAAANGGICCRHDSARAGAIGPARAVTSSGRR